MYIYWSFVFTAEGEAEITKQDKMATDEKFAFQKSSRFFILGKENQTNVDWRFLLHSSQIHVGLLETRLWMVLLGSILQNDAL